MEIAINLRKTMRSMEVGETLEVMKRRANERTGFDADYVRSTATKVKDSLGMSFSVSSPLSEDKITITRIS